MDVTPSAAAGSAAYSHAVKFYNDERELGDTVAGFLAPGLRESLPAIVIATPEHRTVIARELAGRGLDVGRFERDGDLQMLDADDILGRFMAGQEPDSIRFQATIDELIERACKERQPCPVRAYGEMVDVLWKRANANGAIQLEILWNGVATQPRFSLLCGYAVGNFYKEIRTDPAIQTICDLHDHIMPVDQSV